MERILITIYACLCKNQEPKNIFRKLKKKRKKEAKLRNFYNDMLWQLHCQNRFRTRNFIDSSIASLGDRKSGSLSFPPSGPIRALHGGKNIFDWERPLKLHHAKLDSQCLSRGGGGGHIFNGNCFNPPKVFEQKVPSSIIAKDRSHSHIE